MDQVFIQIREEAQSIADANAQVRVLDFYMLSAVGLGRGGGGVLSANY